MENSRKNCIDFIYKIFANDCKNDKNLEFENKYFNTIADNCVKELTQNKKSAEKPFLIRLGGQCGSGKTTQLLPAIKENLKDDNYIHLAVRLFANKHPHYNKLLDEYGQGLIREKTNGYALLCLFKVLEILIQNKYNIFLEMTILDPDFEEYINKLAKKYNFSVLFNVMSIPFEVSNYLVEERRKNNNLEKNRIMPKNTLDFFYNILPLGIENIIKNANIFDENDYFIIWNMLESKPVLISNNFNNEILDIFNKNRVFNKNNFTKIPDFAKKLKEKTEFYKNFLKNVAIFFK